MHGHFVSLLNYDSKVFGGRGSTAPFNSIYSYWPQKVFDRFHIFHLCNRFCSFCLKWKHSKDWSLDIFSRETNKTNQLKKFRLNLTRDIERPKRVRKRKKEISNTDWKRLKQSELRPISRQFGLAYLLANHLLLIKIRQCHSLSCWKYCYICLGFSSSLMVERLLSSIFRSNQLIKYPCVSLMNVRQSFTFSCFAAHFVLRRFLLLLNGSCLGLVLFDWFVSHRSVFQVVQYLQFHITKLKATKRYAKIRFRSNASRRCCFFLGSCNMNNKNSIKKPVIGKYSVHWPQQTIWFYWNN